MSYEIKYPEECDSCSKKGKCLFPETYYETCVCIGCLIQIICSKSCDDRLQRKSRWRKE